MKLRQRRKDSLRAIQSSQKSMRSGKVLKQVWLMMVSIDVGETFIIPSQKRPEASMSQLPQLWERNTDVGKQGHLAGTG